jgi:GMP synthase-like glutamine amidotransferase
MNSLPKTSGFSLVQREDRSKLRLPAQILDYKAIIITGSSYASHPRTNKAGQKYLVSWKTDLIEFIRSTGEQNIPVLGVCFGAQMLAEALGGKVVKGDIPEIGWSVVHKNSNGISEQLLCDVPSTFSAPENHGDWIVRLPESSILLAESDLGIQAFRRGIHFGVEFHPERTPSEVRQTVVDAIASNSKRLAKSGQSIDQLDLLERLYCQTMPNMFHTFLKYALSL